MLALLLIITIGLGVAFGRVLMRGEPETTRSLTLSGQVEGKLVGIHLKNGTTYFGTAVFEDEKTILLREIYVSLGFFPTGEGRPPELQVGKLNEGRSDIPDERAINKDEILFTSNKISSDLIEAINRYQPPSPTPTPLPLASPSPGTDLETSPSPMPLTVTPTPIISPKPEEGISPGFGP